MYSDEKPMKTKYAVVKNGVEENIEVERGEKFTYLDVKGKDMKKIKKIEKINKKISERNKRNVLKTLKII